MVELGWSVSLAATYLVYRLVQTFDPVDLLLLGLEKWIIKVDKGVSKAQAEKVNHQIIHMYLCTYVANYLSYE